MMLKDFRCLRISCAYRSHELMNYTRSLPVYKLCTFSSSLHYSTAFSLDGVAPSQMVCVSASVNLPLHSKVQKFSSGTGSPGWSWKKDRKTVVVVWFSTAFGSMSQIIWLDSRTEHILILPFNGHFFRGSAGSPLVPPLTPVRGSSISVKALNGTHSWSADSFLFLSEGTALLLSEWLFLLFAARLPRHASDCSLVVQYCWSSSRHLHGEKKAVTLTSVLASSFLHLPPYC